MERAEANRKRLRRSYTFIITFCCFTYFREISKSVETRITAIVLILQDKVAAETRVSFDCITNQQSSAYLHIQNIGTTAVFYEWRKVPQSLSFDVLKPNTVQRFYFNTSEGNIAWCYVPQTESIFLNQRIYCLQTFNCQFKT